MDFVFAENATVEDINRVPEQFRGLYAEQDGKYALPDQFKPVAAAIDGFNKSNKTIRKQFDEFKKTVPDVSAWTGLGEVVGVEGDVTPDSVRAAIEGLMEKATKGEQGKVNWDKMKRDLENAHRRALESKDGELQKMHGSLVKHMVNAEAVRALATHKGSPDLLLPIIAARTKVVEDNGEYVVRVVDESGDPRGNASGGFMSIEDLVKELKASPTFGRAFESESPGTAGGGGKPGAASARVQQKSDGDLSPIDRIKKGLAARQR